jgi:hypothetical protein
MLKASAVDGPAGSNAPDRRSMIASAIRNMSASISLFVYKRAIRGLQGHRTCSRGVLGQPRADEVSSVARQGRCLDSTILGRADEVIEWPPGPARPCESGGNTAAIDAKAELVRAPSRRRRSEHR